jgi:subtilisin family serine protease
VKNKLLIQQIERILDENAAQTVSVIVQGNQPSLADAFKEAAEGVLKSRSVTRPHALLPSPFKHQKPAPARDDVRKSEIQTLVHAGRKAVQSIESSTFLLGAKLARKSDERGRPRVLQMAGAAVLEMDRDDLSRVASELPEILAIYPNRRISPPPRMRSVNVPQQVSRRTSHNWGLEVTGALSCWGAFGARGQGVKVAVLDTGVEATHPDLKGKVKQFVSIDAKGGVKLRGVANARDDDGHGTHVCGTIVGGQASGRWIGMAPEASLYVAQVLGRSGGTDEQVLAGMEWAVQSGADVINMSLGGLSFDPDVLDTYSAAIVAARAAGVPVVAAIGNEGAQVTGSPGNDLFAFAVGASDVVDCIAAFSGGRTQVVERSQIIAAVDLPFVYSKPDLCAPGVDIYSCAGKKGWGYESGSSMAAPHVAGAMALLLSNLPGKTRSVLFSLGGSRRAQVLQDLLIGSVNELGENGQDHRYGWGRLNVLDAYASAVELGYIASP